MIGFAVAFATFFAEPFFAGSAAFRAFFAAFAGALDTFSKTFSGLVAGFLTLAAFFAFTGVNVVPIVGFSPLGRVTANFLALRAILALRTGTRAVKTQPTPRTGLPPINRPTSKSHGYSS